MLVLAEIAFALILGYGVYRKSFRWWNQNRTFEKQLDNPTMDAFVVEDGKQPSNTKGQTPSSEGFSADEREA